jgi:O-antigen polymerase
VLVIRTRVVAFLLSVVVFRLLLDISYIFVISDVFYYEGYRLELKWNEYFLSWVVYVISLRFVPIDLSKVSDYFFVSAILSVIAPLTSMYGLDESRQFFPVFIVVLSVFFIYFIINIKLFSFKNIPYIKGGVASALAISSIFVIFLVLWYYFSGVTFVFDISKVYEYRNANAELAAGGIFSYTNNWTYQIFNIFLMAFSLFYRRYFVFVLLFIVQLYFFSASTHKTVVFLPVILIGVWFYFRKTSSLIVVPITFSLLLASTILSFLFFSDIWLSSLFSRRVFFVPANLTFVYFDFFSENSHVYWSNSVLSGFFTYPYDISLTHVIGRYLGNEDMGANNGFVASGYAHAGIFGVFFYTIIVGLVLRFINDITCDSFPLWLSVALSIVPLRTLLISSDLFTVMLTHGFMVAILLMLLSRFKYA